MSDYNEGVLAITLAAAVPLRIIELEAKGGPDAADREKATEYGAILATKGDILQYGSKKKGEAADLFNGLAHAISVLAFAPGGVEVFGGHYVGIVKEGN